MDRNKYAERRENEWIHFLSRQCSVLLNIAEVLGNREMHTHELCFLAPWFRDEMLPAIQQLDSFSAFDGWPIGVVDRVKPALSEFFGDRRSEVPVEYMRHLIPDGLGDLLSTTRVVRIEPVDDEDGLVSGVALIETAPLFAPDEVPPTSLLYALQQMDLDDHKGRSKLHLHPLAKKDGVHLGYKLVFDPKLGQEWLSWEDHGDRAWKRTWKDPAWTVLPEGTSKALHKGSLAAVQADRKYVKAGMKFPNWAKMFESASNSAYVAHPQVEFPTLWPRPFPITSVLSVASTVVNPTSQLGKRRHHN